MFKVLTGDCLDVMASLPDNSVDSIVTDPPYGISFMGKAWDKAVPSVDVWKQALRVLKPGGHILCFAGTRTQHRMACALEDAGFEIRDLIGWMYGSGFPKSHDISKAIDKAAGAEREKVRKPCAATAYSSNAGNMRPWMERARELGYTEVDGGAPATDAARQWQGWGSALKPAFEPITLARKPLAKGHTLADSVLEFGTGGLNIDGCRVGEIGDTRKSGATSRSVGCYGDGLNGGGCEPIAKGRFPANLTHDGSDEVLALFPAKAGAAAPVRRGHPGKSKGIYGDYNQKGDDGASFRGDKGSAARFFYCAKASKKDRDDGLLGFDVKRTGAMQATADGSMLTGSGNERATARANTHPTVKPTALMEYLCRLITPPGGTVLDPFCGSGSTGRGAVLNGFDFIGIELDPENVQISIARIQAAIDKAEAV